jgi:hypothetical protein
MMNGRGMMPISGEGMETRGILHFYQYVGGDLVRLISLETERNVLDVFDHVRRLPLTFHENLEDLDVVVEPEVNDELVRDPISFPPLQGKWLLNEFFKRKRLLAKIRMPRLGASE